jgi:PAS domain-containing protein
MGGAMQRHGVALEGSAETVPKRVAVMISTLAPDPVPMTVDALRLRRALNAAQLGSWQHDPTRRVFSWDVRSKEILGTDENETTVEEFMTWVHPHDAERVWVAYEAALDATEFRLRRANGEKCR